MSEPTQTSAETAERLPPAPRWSYQLIDLVYFAFAIVLAVTAVWAVAFVQDRSRSQLEDELTERHGGPFEVGDYVGVQKKWVIDGEERLCVTLDDGLRCSTGTEHFDLEQAPGHKRRGEPAGPFARAAGRRHADGGGEWWTTAVGS